MNYEQWDNLPWTPRGRKFKWIVENFVMGIGLFIIMAISGTWQ